MLLICISTLADKVHIDVGILFAGIVLPVRSTIIHGLSLGLGFLQQNIGRCSLTLYNFNPSSLLDSELIVCEIRIFSQLYLFDAYFMKG